MSECGECTMCCKIKGIDAPDLQKKEFVWCQHCDKGKGCKIYDTRPAPCREYWCVWLDARSRGEVPLSLRPDKCKVVMDITQDQKTLVLWVDPAYPGAASEPQILDFLSRVKAKINVVIAIGDRRQVVSVSKEGEATLEQFRRNYNFKG